MKNSKKQRLIESLSAALFVMAAATAGQGDMIILSSTQSISGLGTQLPPIQASGDAIGFYSDDLLNTGYVRDENNAIVGNVSAFASLMSSVTETHVRGLGRGSGFATAASEGEGTAEMKVVFRTDTSMSYALEGQLRLAPHTLGLNGSQAVISLTGSQGLMFEVRLDEEHPPDQLGIVNFMGADRIQGELPAGEYTLEAIGLGHGSDGLTRCIDFDFTFGQFKATPVPEPGGLYLLAGGVFCALRRRTVVRTNRRHPAVCSGSRAVKR